MASTVAQWSRWVLFIFKDLIVISMRKRIVSKHSLVCKDTPFFQLLLLRPYSYPREETTGERLSLLLILEVVVP